MNLRRNRVLKRAHSCAQYSAEAWSIAGARRLTGNVDRQAQVCIAAENLLILVVH